MKYEGPLFGRQGRRLIPLKLTSQDVDRMEEDLESMEQDLAEARSLLLMSLRYLKGQEPGRSSGGIRNERLASMIEKHLHPSLKADNLGPLKRESGAGSHDVSQCKRMIAVDVQSGHFVGIDSQGAKLETGSKLMDEFLAREIEKIGETKKLPEWISPASGCHCRACNPQAWWMIVCPDCGSKRCPKASRHENSCTGSNQPGQPGAD